MPPLIKWEPYYEYLYLAFLKSFEEFPFGMRLSAGPDRHRKSDTDGFIGSSAAYPNGSNIDGNYRHN
jgi:hypothetical protein